MEVPTKLITYVVTGMLGCCICIFFGSNTFAEPVSYKQFVNHTYGVEIQYPSDWTIDKTNYYPNDTRLTTIATFASDFDSPKDMWRDYVSIVYDKIPYKAELNEYLDEASNSYKDYKNFHLVSSSSGNAMLAGHPAYNLTYTYRTEDESPIDLKVTEIGTIVGRNGYYLEFYSQKNSYTDYIPMFNKMIKSFQITGPEGFQDTAIPSIAESVNDTQFTTLSDTNMTGHEFQGTTSPAGPGLKSYENYYFGIRKLEYPDGWSVNENETSIQFISPAKGTSPPSVQITTYLSENRTLEDFVEDDYRYLSSDPNSYQIIESKPINLKGNQPAHMEVFAFFDNQSNVFKDLTVLTIKNDALYVISYFAQDDQYQKYLPVVINLIRSLDLVTSSEVQNNENIIEPPAVLSPL